jgi:hypothetical protein
MFVQQPATWSTFNPAAHSADEDKPLSCWTDRTRPILRGRPTDIGRQENEIIRLLASLAKIAPAALRPLRKNAKRRRYADGLSARWDVLTIMLSAPSACPSSSSSDVSRQCRDSIAHPQCRPVPDRQQAPRLDGGKGAQQNWVAVLRESARRNHSSSSWPRDEPAVGDSDSENPNARWDALARPSRDRERAAA